MRKMSDDTRKRLAAQIAMTVGMAKAARLGLTKPADLAAIIYDELEKAGYTITRQRDKTAGLVCTTCHTVFIPSGSELADMFDASATPPVCNHCKYPR